MCGACTAIGHAGCRTRRSQEHTGQYIHQVGQSASLTFLATILISVSTCLLCPGPSLNQVKRVERLFPISDYVASLVCAYCNTSSCSCPAQGWGICARSWTSVMGVEHSQRASLVTCPHPQAFCSLLQELLLFPTLHLLSMVWPSYWYYHESDNWLSWSKKSGPNSTENR